MPETTEERRARFRKAYIAAISQNPWVLRFIADMSTMNGDLVVLKLAENLPTEGLEPIRDFCKGISKDIDADVVICPDGFDITAMARADAVNWLKELAKLVGCEVIDPTEPIEPIVFPKLAPEAMADMLQAIRNSPPGTITALRE